LMMPWVRRLCQHRDDALRKVAELENQRDDALTKVAALEERLVIQRMELASQFSKYTLLPSDLNARFALPLDYPPSRVLKPRWGATQPPIKPLSDWIGAHDATYHELLRDMQNLRAPLNAISRDFSHEKPDAAWVGVPFAPFDLAVLYTLISRTHPARYLEIGSGASTLFARRAIKDQGLSTRIISIDPEPRAEIDAICDEVIREGLEVCDMALFDQLEPGDIVFLDGSHRVFMNSDVTVFMIDVLPNLKPGVLVHLHDIALPWDYGDMFINWYWSEAYILAAYLIGARGSTRPVFPTAWVCRSPQFSEWFAEPLVDLGTLNDGWRGGGSMWFTHLN
jgi:predicted O-methyltransferase YrrM